MATTMMPAKDEVTVLEHATLKVSGRPAQTTFIQSILSGPVRIAKQKIQRNPKSLRPRDSVCWQQYWRAEYVCLEAYWGECSRDQWPPGWGHAKGDLSEAQS